MRAFRYLFGIIFCFAMSAAAQVGTATVAGAVEDETHARIADAIIKLVNPLTGTESHSRTNGVGIFALAGILPGSYTLQVARDGFATAQFTGIVLSVGDAKQFLIRMKVGAVDQTVAVDASGMTLNSTDASVSTVVNRKFVLNVPLNGRSFQDLISMTPGVTTESPQTLGGPGANGSQFSIDGQRADANSFTIDGVSGNVGTGPAMGNRIVAASGRYAGTTALGTTQGLISLDALEEFRVLNSSYSAEYGGPPGGQFTLLTRSGTNSFHGSGYDYSRVSIFDANDWFTQYNIPNGGQSQYSLFASGWTFHQQDFGGALSGPIALPGLHRGRNRTFFFVSYEGLKVSQPTAPWIQYVPDVSLRTDIPPALQPVIDAFPSPTANSAATTGLVPFILGAFPSPGHIDSTSMRVDHIYSPKLSAFLRFGDTPSESESRNISSRSTVDMATTSWTLGATSNLSATKNNDLRVGYARTWAQLRTVVDEFTTYFLKNTIDLNGLLGVPSLYNSTHSEVYIRIPDTGESFLRTDDTSGSTRQWDVRDTFDLQSGPHLFKFGFDQRNIVSPMRPAGVSLVANFFSRNSIASNSANELAITKSLPATPTFNEFAAFVQDDWRLSKRVNLSLGLRWEIDPPPGEAHGEDAYTVRGDIESPAMIRLATRGTPLWRTDWINLAPRLGVAWQTVDAPGRELVVRGGAGVFFDNPDQQAVGAFEAFGFSASERFSNASLPAEPSQFDFNANPDAPGTSSAVYLFPTHLQLPYTLQWNVSAERALGTRQAFTLSYVGAAGRRLAQLERRNISQSNPEFSDVYFFPHGITSNYQSLQAKFQRTISPGLQALASYTWAHALDFGSTDPVYPLIRGNSDLDLRHNAQAAISWDEKTRTGGAWLRQNVMNGWGADWRVFVRSAFPVMPLGNLSLDPVTGYRYYSSVDLIPNRPLYLSGHQYPGGRMLNGGPNSTLPAFALPNSASEGNLPRNQLRGFGAWEANLSLRKDLQVYHGLHLQFRAEAFNLFNHPDLGYIDPHVTDQLFGQSTLMLNQSFGTAGSLYQQGGPRSAQFMVRVSF